MFCTMQEVGRRAVILGAVLTGLAGPSIVGPAPVRGAPTQDDDVDLALLRRTFALATEARQMGGAPYGALVADAGGNIVAEQRNTSGVTGGDPTRHAELVAVASAWKALDYNGMGAGTLYASTEPCTMCAGAILQARPERVVWGAPEPVTGASGSAIDVFRDARLPTRIPVESGVLAGESSALLRAFFAERRGG